VQIESCKCGGRADESVSQAIVSIQRAYANEKKKGWAGNPAGFRVHECTDNRERTKDIQTNSPLGTRITQGKREQENNLSRLYAAIGHRGSYRLYERIG